MAPKKKVEIEKEKDKVRKVGIGKKIEAKRQRSGVSKDSVRFYKTCPVCKKVCLERLSLHMPKCLPGVIDEDRKARYNFESNKLLEDLSQFTVLKKQPLKDLCKRTVTQKELYRLLQKYLIERGHFFDSGEDSGSDFEDPPDLPFCSSTSVPRLKRIRLSSLSSSNASGIATAATSRKRFFFNDSDDNEEVQEEEEEREHLEEEVIDEPAQAKVDSVLKAQLDAAEAPFFINPKKQYTNNQSKHYVGQDNDLHMCLPENIKILIQFRYQQRRHKIGEQSIVARSNIVSRVLAFIFSNYVDVSLSRVNDVNTLARVLTYEHIDGFIVAHENLNYCGETITGYARAMVNFIKFLLLTKIENREHKDALKEVKDQLLDKLKSQVRVIRAEQKDKCESDYLSGKILPSIAEHRAFFYRDIVQKKLHEVVKRLKESDQLQTDDYVFLLQFLVALISLHEVKRTQIAKNLTVAQWEAAPRIVRDGTALRVPQIFEHKNWVTSPSVGLAIEEKDAELFDLFLSKCRDKIVPRATEVLTDTKNRFFLNVSNGKPISNPTDINRALQERFGIKKADQISCRQGRKIVETESAIRLKNNPQMQNLVSNYQLNHSRKTGAGVHYTQQQAGLVVPSYFALKELASNPLPSSSSSSLPSTSGAKSTRSAPLHTVVSTLEEAGVGEEKKRIREFLRTKHLTKGAFSTAPTEMLLKGDQELLERITNKSNLEDTIKYFYDCIREDLRKMRIQYIAQELVNKFNASYSEEERSNRDKTWALDAAKIQRNNVWPLSIEFARILPTARRLLAARTNQSGVVLEQQDKEPELMEPIVAPPLPPPLAPASTKICVIYSDKEILQHSREQSWPGLSIKENLPGRGRGLFVASNTSFASHQLICDYQGELFSSAEHKLRMHNTERSERGNVKDYRMSFVLYEKDKIKTRSEIKNQSAQEKALSLQDQEKCYKYTIEAHKNDNRSYGRLINHSACENHVNCKPVASWRKDENGLNIPVVLFFTTKMIKPGAELLWNYSLGLRKESDGFRDKPWFHLCPHQGCKNEIPVLNE